MPIHFSVKLLPIIHFPSAHIILQEFHLTICLFQMYCLAFIPTATLFLTDELQVAHSSPIISHLEGVTCSELLLGGGIELADEPIELRNICFVNVDNVLKGSLKLLLQRILQVHIVIGNRAKVLE